MKITVQSSKTIQPCYVDGWVASDTTTDVVPLTVLDKVNFDMYISVIYVFRPPMPPNAVLEAGLAKVLTEYREWAGRLEVDADGNRTILLNDKGARFVEATADVTLDSVLPLKPTTEVVNLHPSGNGAVELMLIQVTRFACGSLVIGFTTQHIVSDGRATSNFFLAWSQATRGASLNPMPVHDRVSFFRPRDPRQVEFEHRGVEFKLARSNCSAAAGAHEEQAVLIHKVNFSREIISKLKSQASGGAHRPCSTMRCLVAHLWRCITVARGLDGCVATSACIAVDGRARMTPPVPNGYTGNVVLWARPTTTASELVTRPLQHAVELINRELARLNNSYFRSFIDFATSGAVEKEGLVPTADAAETVLSPNIEVHSWLQIPFCDVDFGGGRPAFFMPSYLPDEGVLILSPSCVGNGSVDAYVALFSHHMDAFKNCCYSVDY